MQSTLFAAVAIAAGYLVTLGLCLFRLAGSTGEAGRDMLIGAAALAIGLLLAVFGYLHRP
ncbi:MAG TPA: hypothetical protein VGE56_00770 [Rhodocyclaceae bacterium]